MRTWQDTIDAMLARVDATATDVTEGFPHHADPETGVWTTSPQGDWTGGFWNGMLWLAAHSTGDARYHDAAVRWTEELRPRARSETIFRGFLFYYGAALGHMLFGDETAREIAISGARGLAELYNPAAELIPLGDEAEEASDVGRGDANIDGVQATALLAWAAQQTGDERLHDIGVQHALRHIELCIRDDDSVCQSASFDVGTGEKLRAYTHKGYAHDSTWTRAQAWSMLGYAMAAMWDGHRTAFVDAAVRTTDWWIVHVPADKVAYWDFDAPITPATKRDTAGTAVAAAAMLKLSAIVDDAERSARYRQEAEATAAALVAYVTPTHADDRRPVGALTRACYNHRIGLATESEFIPGSYFLFEALHTLAGHLEPSQL